ncbi:MAG TPA: hypothetical protein VMI34_18370 [Candidatus Bathyarchaeia archaeon]|nr:hypothetical protein [Candidatus Bathyarchaeia archaeon]
MAQRLWTGAMVVAAVLVGGCASSPPVFENTTRGPMSAEMQIVRSFVANGREPGWDEKRQYNDQLDEKVFKYLREHPEIEQDNRYMSFRFWRQVSIGSTKEEVIILLEEPDSRTIDPALMAALSRRHWQQVQGKAKEAWVYPLGWVLYLDDKAVVSMIRERGAWDKHDDQ